MWLIRLMLTGLYLVLRLIDLDASSSQNSCLLSKKGEIFVELKMRFNQRHNKDNANMFPHWYLKLYKSPAYDSELAYKS